MIKIARLAYVVLVIGEKCFKTVIDSPRKKDGEIMAELGERRGTSICMHVCMYLLIGKEQSAQKRSYWGENRIKRIIYE